MSVFDMGDWEELDVGILGDGATLDDFIVTDLGNATHKRYRNQRTGEIIVDRI